MAPNQRLALILILGATSVGCNKERARTEPVAAPAAKAMPVFVADGQGNAERTDDETARAVSGAVNELLNAPAEKLDSTDANKSKDASALLGTWAVVHTVSGTNGKFSSPAKPLAPTKWQFDKGGKLTIHGGMKMDLSYVYTGKSLIVAGLGPKQSYEIAKLTKSDLEVKMVIAAGTVRIENTTLLRKL